MPLPRTAIIGAGVAGLTAGKALADRGVPYACFETSDDIGGNWYFKNPNGRSSAYRSLHIDISHEPAGGASENVRAIQARLQLHFTLP